MFPHHPWESEGLCLDTVQHSHQQFSTPAGSQGARPNPAPTCRQCVEAVGSPHGHGVSERPRGAALPFHRSAEVRLRERGQHLAASTCYVPEFLQTCETLPGLLLSLPNL